MNYKGYIGSVEFDEESRVLHGRIQNIRDVVSYEADTASQLIEEFHKSVDDYLAWCRELGQDPEKPFSGNLAVRIPPELHEKLSAEATRLGESMNSLITEAIKERLKKASLKQQVVERQRSAAKSQSSSASGRRGTSTTRSRTRTSDKSRTKSGKTEEQVTT
jgi:predicted HicB family RNase H-like nuclease